nr:HK97 family phage prohead protease [uncultured Moraxella sp.]
MSRAFSTFKVKSVSDDGEQRIITGIATTPKPDRDNDIIDPKGAKFALPIPLLWQHNHNQPIGEVIEARISDDGIEIVAKIAKIDEEGKLKDRIDEAWQSIKSGLVKCFSVGLRLLDYAYHKDGYGLDVKEWECYEISVVTVPANSDAIITSVKDFKKAFADGAVKAPAIGGENTPEVQTDAKSAITATAQGGVSPEQKPIQNLNQNLVSFQSVLLIDPNQGSVELL